MDNDNNEKVVAIVRRFSRKDKRDVNITPETRLFDDLHVNSASRVDIVLELEDEFGIEIADEEADSMSTVGEVVKAVERKLAAR